MSGLSLHLVLYQVVILLITASLADAQRIAFIEPEKQSGVAGFVHLLQNGIGTNLKVIDISLSESAFRSVESQNIFNLTTDEGKRIGSVIGCDHFILMRTQTQRRESLDRGTYYEAYAAAFVVNARSGRLDGWLLNSVDERSPEKAEQLLRDQTRSISSDIVKIVKDPKNANQQKSSGKFEMVPSDDSPLAQGLKPPIPYRRIKPEYTSMAFLYGIRGTVEIEVDIAADGNVERTSIEHWAGYGLDESVEKAVRSMNWRPAMRNGKALAMRVLLRYNFTKIEKDNDEP